MAWTILVPQPGIKPLDPLHWKQGVLTTGPSREVPFLDCLLGINTCQEILLNFPDEHVYNLLMTAFSHFSLNHHVGWDFLNSTVASISCA